METLIKIQGELKAPKNQFNSFGKYKYRSCEDILEAVKPLCVKNNALLTLTDKIIQVGTQTFVEATAMFKHGDFSHSVSASAKHSEVKKGMDDSQITGSSSSYARKYALNGLFCIDDTKDNDTQQKITAEKKLNKLPQEKFNGAVKFLKSGKTMDELKMHWNIDSETEQKLLNETKI